MNLKLVCLFFAGAALLSGAAQAATEVLGDGPARLCFLSANEGRNAGGDIAICDSALVTDLTTRDRAATFINRGVIRLSLNQYDAANDDFSTGIRLLPDMGEGYLNRGAAYIAQKRFSEALADIEKGMSLGVSKPYIGYYDRGIANEALGNLRAAYDDYRQAVALEPEFTRAAKQLERFKLIDKPNGT